MSACGALVALSPVPDRSKKKQEETCFQNSTSIYKKEPIHYFNWLSISNIVAKYDCELLNIFLKFPEQAHCV